MSSYQSKYGPAFIVGFFILIAILIRLKFHGSGNYVLAGVDGPYSALQARSMLERFHLALPDMPLLFMAEALIARLLQLSGLGTLNDCVLLAVTGVDIVIPPLAAIPVFLFAKELNTPFKGMGFPNYVVIGYSILNVTPVLLFSNNFQKNAVAVIYIFLYFYYILRILKYQSRKDIIISVLIFILCCLTHFGSASIILLFTLTTGVVHVRYDKRSVRSIGFKTIATLTCAFALFLLILLHFDNGRLERLVHMPFKVFEAPVLLLILNGQNIGEYFNPVNLVVPSMLIGIAALLYYRTMRSLDKEIRILCLGLLITGTLLCSPLIGLEWAGRLYMMSYVPIVGTYLILFKVITNKLALSVPIMIFLSTMAFAIARGYSSPMLQCISNDAYEEFRTLDHSISLHGKTAVVARQDLRVLASWEFGTIGMASYLIDERDMNKYSSIYFIDQMSGINYTQEEAWRKLPIPVHSFRIFKGNFFDVYNVRSLERSNYTGKRRSKAKGTIIRLEHDRFTLYNELTSKSRTVRFTTTTRSHLLPSHDRIKVGMVVEVWGEGIPFSLDLQAEEVVEH